MDREEAKLYIKNHLEDYLQMRGINTSRPFRCLNPEHKDVHPSMNIYRAGKNGPHCKCFGCGAYYDIFDIIGIDYHLVNDAEIFDKGYELFGVAGSVAGTKAITEADSGPNRAQRGTDDEGEAQKPAREAQDAPESHAGDAAGPDYRKYYAQCAARITDPAAVAYLSGRGISLDVAQAAGVGYDPDADPAAAPGGVGTSRHPIPRLIIPVAPSYYIARATDPAAEYRYINPAGGHAAIYQAEFLQAEGAIYVVEGALDALSIAEAGERAIALNSIANTGLLVDLIKAGIRAHLILCLDNDDRGRKAEAELCGALQHIDGISYTCADICGEYKDPNEALQADHEGFVAAVRRTVRDLQRPGNLQSYLETRYDADREIYGAGGKRTGFDRWDRLTNGLHAGVYMLAAAPGTGKTTLAWQICDNLATAGEDVLYATLEQSALDLATKSIARRARLAGISATIEDIKVGTYRADREQADLIRDVEDRITIIEGNFGLTAADICQRVESYIQRTGKRPIVIIDYLQALQPLEAGRRAGNREAIEDTADLICGLKNRYNLTIIVISSVSRANYRTSLDIDSLKESGRLEYDADAVYTLEFSCIFGKNQELFDNDGDINRKKRILAEAKEATTRQMCLRCVKSRFCPPGAKSDMLYYSDADTFAEIPDKPMEGHGEAAHKSKRL